MKRSDFLKKVDVGAAAVIILPQVFNMTIPPTPCKNGFKEVKVGDKTLLLKELSGFSDNTPIDINYKLGYILPNNN